MSSAFLRSIHLWLIRLAIKMGIKKPMERPLSHELSLFLDSYSIPSYYTQENNTGEMQSDYSSARTFSIDSDPSLCSASSNTPSQSSEILPSSPLNGSTIVSCEPSLPVIFQQEANRYMHFSDTHAPNSRPKPIILLTLDKIRDISPKTLLHRHISFVFTPAQLPHAIGKLFLYERSLLAVTLAVEIDCFMSIVRTHEYYVVKQWCFNRSIQLGCYLYQTKEKIFVNQPRFNAVNASAFHFHILDTCAEDKYNSIQDISNYIQQIGVPSNRIVPLYIPHAPTPIKLKNYMGYFFRSDLCHSAHNRKRYAVDIAYKLN
jgi:hypothetical protein